MIWIASGIESVADSMMFLRSPKPPKQGLETAAAVDGVEFCGECLSTNENGKVRVLWPSSC